MTKFSKVMEEVKLMEKAMPNVSIMMKIINHGKTMDLKLEKFKETKFNVIQEDFQLNL